MYALIDSYVEKDPTAFCTYEEFQKGVATLKEFCSLRTESVKLQLSGSTDSVDASDLNLSDMGTMSHGMGNNGPENKGESNTSDETDEQGGNGMSDNMQNPGGMQGPGGMQSPDGMQMPGGMMGGMGSSTTPGTGNSIGISVDYIMIGASLFVLLIGILFVSRFKR